MEFFDFLFAKRKWLKRNCFCHFPSTAKESNQRSAAKEGEALKNRQGRCDFRLHIYADFTRSSPSLESPLPKLAFGERWWGAFLDGYWLE